MTDTACVSLCLHPCRRPNTSFGPTNQCRIFFSAPSLLLTTLRCFCFCFFLMCSELKARGSRRNRQPPPMPVRLTGKRKGENQSKTSASPSHLQSKRGKKPTRSDMGRSHSPSEKLTNQEDVSACVHLDDTHKLLSHHNPSPSWCSPPSMGEPAQQLQQWPTDHTPEKLQESSPLT